MRNIIWTWVRSKHPEGMVLPMWLLVIKAVLYPLDFIYWRMDISRGYQWESDCWLIEGVRYSEQAFRWMANAQGETYRITRSGETLTLERVHIKSV